LGSTRFGWPLFLCYTGQGNKGAQNFKQAQRGLKWRDLMKKVLTLMLTGVLAFSLSACGTTEDTTPTPDTTTGPNTSIVTEPKPTPVPKETGFRIAMITDIGDIDDGSFNQGTWEGVEAFAKANDIAYRYYRPLAVSDNDYLDTIALAIEGGAEVVVTPGFLFEPAIYEAQKIFPDVTFILLDGVPHAGDYATYEIASNTLSLLFDEHESGFLAGYAAVKDGLTDLGYLGGIAVPAVVRFGVGYLAGASYAAKEDGVTIDVSRYEYLGNFEASDDNKNKAASWYLLGTEVIFVAAGAAGFSVASAADEAGTLMIGVDVDQSIISDSVLTSAMKALAVATQDGLQAWLDGTFEGGRTVYMNASNDGVALPMDTSRFTTFDVATYDVIFARIATGELVVPKDYAGLLDFATTYGLNTTTFPNAATVG
jgi:basic membrane protein A and related proteins